MKTLKIFLFSLVFASFSFAGFAQDQSETFKVSGECGMCQKKIEGAAKSAGASFASWDTDTKTMVVKYDAKKTDNSKIQQAIARAGYDTPSFKATEEAYNNLHSCCKYDRTSDDANQAKKQASTCCDSDKCDHSDCFADGKCKKDMSCCAEGPCKEKDCCKKS